MDIKKKQEIEEFILANSEEFVKAREHGYDIRMDEDEIFYWMDKYANHVSNRLDAYVMLRSLAKQLNQWAEQSKTGGWSTHQVEPMQNKAFEIHRFLDTAEIE